MKKFTFEEVIIGIIALLFIAWMLYLLTGCSSSSKRGSFTLINGCAVQVDGTADVINSKVGRISKITPECEVTIETEAE